jgi:hypothetical protein
MYGFGEEVEPTEQGQGEQGPKWFREQMAKVSGDIKALRDENAALRAEKARQEVEKKLTAQGYAPQAAGLYTGTPEELDSWLAANGGALAKTGGEAAGEAGQGVQGTPQSVVPAESQQALAAFSAAGTDGAPALSGEDALVARMDSFNNPEEFKKFMREQGNRRF